MPAIRLDKPDGGSVSVAEMLEAVAILEAHGIKVVEVTRVPSEKPPDAG
jgi:hypothetical protein